MKDKNYSVVLPPDVLDKRRTAKRHTKPQKQLWTKTINNASIRVALFVVLLAALI